jgi:hypothetical protein
MAIDFRASQFRGAKFISSGSTGTGAKLVFYDISADSTTTPNIGSINSNKFSTTAIGTDIFIYFSGSNGLYGSFDVAGKQVISLPDTVFSGSAVFKSSSLNSTPGIFWRGDLAAASADVSLYTSAGSGNEFRFYNDFGSTMFTTIGEFNFQGGPAKFVGGLSGSLTKLDNGDSYLVAGTNITIVSNSNGSVTISSTASGSSSGSGGNNQQRLTVAAAMSTVSTASIMAGQFYWNSADWTTVPTDVKLRLVGNVTSPPHTASFRLYNLTNSQFVNIDTSQYMSITASNSTYKVGTNILSSLSASSIFELRMSSSLSQSMVTLGHGELLITF